MSRSLSAGRDVTGPSVARLWPAFIKELLALLRTETQGALGAGGGSELSAKGPAAWRVGQGTADGAPEHCARLWGRGLWVSPVGSARGLTGTQVGPLGCGSNLITL